MEIQLICNNLFEFVRVFRVETRLTVYRPLDTQKLLGHPMVVLGPICTLESWKSTIVGQCKKTLPGNYVASLSFLGKGCNSIIG